MERDTPDAGRAAIAAAAIHLIGDGVDAATLTARFATAGAPVAHGVAEQALTDLAALGLVRVGRGTGLDRQRVLTTLGQRALAAGVAGDAAVPLAELERLRTDLLSTIAHELRTPLTAVRTSAGLLLDPRSEPTDEQRRTLLATIERNAERMQRLVGDILDLSRFRSGAIRLQLRRFDAAALGREVIATVRPLASDRGQEIRLIAPDGEPITVFGDHRRLEQALLNLASNAQRFAPAGGHITLGVEREGHTVRWSVSDDGPGIPPDEIGRLFERFFVGRSDRNEPREGVGLGLPTALAIAQAHGGRIDVDSRPGAGSTFTLVVPADGPADDAPGDG